MEALIAGYRRFREGSWLERRKLFESLARDGQRPQALVIACVDSRVDPAMIFDAPPGEILTLRNVANLVPPYAPNAGDYGAGAALEFGVQVLEVPHVIVLGHGQCGGVRALLEGAPPNARDFVAPWMHIAEPARLRCLSHDNRQESCEREVVKLSLANLMTFPWVARRVAAGALALHGAWFAIHSGILMTLRPDGTFAPVDEARIRR